eukprot:11840998-Alexandrium_andersonii.AAC.1
MRGPRAVRAGSQCTPVVLSLEVATEQPPEAGTAPACSVGDPVSFLLACDKLLSHLQAPAALLAAAQHPTSRIAL